MTDLRTQAIEAMAEPGVTMTRKQAGDVLDAMLDWLTANAASINVEMTMQGPGNKTARQFSTYTNTFDLVDVLRGNDD